MRLHFSNKNLWNRYFKILIIISISLFLFMFLLYKIILLLVLLFVLIFLSTYLAFNIKKTYKKVYLQMENNMITIYNPFKSEDESLDLNKVTSFIINGSSIVFICEDKDKYKIDLKYLNADDTKRLIKYLKYHPAIKNKKFFL